MIEPLAIPLRDYQAEAIKAIRAKRRKKKSKDFHARRALVVIPTGGGKTLVAAYEIYRELHYYHGNVLILAHREILLEQMRDEILALDPTADIGLVGFDIEEWDHDIILGGVQTLSCSQERLEKLRKRNFTLIITDEAHHILSASYRLIHQYAENDASFAIGVTATSDRGDNHDASEFYGPPVFLTTIRKLIAEGYLCDLKPYVIKTKTRLDLEVKGKDYNQEELEYVVNRKDRNVLIVQACKDAEMGGPDIPTVCFCAGTVHAIQLAQTYCAMGITARALLGDTSKEERKEIYRDFNSGALKVITNVDVCSEGWNMPDIRRICLCAPTQVRARHIQRIGRGARKSPETGKEFCYILDFSDDTASHSLEPITLSDVFEMPVLEGELLTESHRKARQSEAAQAKTQKERDDIFNLLFTEEELHKKQVEILGNFPWKNLKDKKGHQITIGKNKLFLVEAAKPGEYNVGMQFQSNPLEPHQPFVLGRNLPKGWAIAMIEQKAKLLQAGDYHLVDPNAPWRFLPVTSEQLKILRPLQRKGVISKSIVLKSLKRGEANDMICRKRRM